MSYGVTLDGFVIKRLQDIKAEMEASLRAAFGNQINLLPTELLGQIVGIMAEREAIVWELAQQIYDSQYPDSASGVNLDNVVAVTGIKRLEATKAYGTITAFGTLGTVVPVGCVVSVDGNPDARFKTLEAKTIGAGTNEIQVLSFSSVPASGQWAISYDGEATGVLAWNCADSDVETALESLTGLTSVSVSGDFAGGFVVEFDGADGSKPHSMIKVVTNTLYDGGAVAVTIQVTELQAGVLPNVDIAVEAEEAGDIRAYAGTLTIIETTVAGWSAVTNASDIDNGRDIESDAALRLRRGITLQTSGDATVESIRSRLLEIDNVTAVRVFENVTDVTDSFGRPPHSIECVVEGGTDTDIAELIWQVKGAGIETYGGDSETVYDSQGFPHTINFSRPTPIDIYVDAALVVDPLVYPTGGDDAVKQAIVDFAKANWGIGADVIYTELFGAIHQIEGILEIDLKIDTAPAPAGVVNIAINDDEIASFDTANIAVTS